MLIFFKKTILKLNPFIFTAKTILIISKTNVILMINANAFSQAVTYVTPYEKRPLLAKRKLYWKSVCFKTGRAVCTTRVNFYCLYFCFYCRYTIFVCFKN